MFHCYFFVLRSLPLMQRAYHPCTLLSTPVPHTDAVESELFCSDPDRMFEWDDIVQVGCGSASGGHSPLPSRFRVQGEVPCGSFGCLDCSGHQSHDS